MAPLPPATRPGTASQQFCQLQEGRQAAPSWHLLSTARRCRGAALGCPGDCCTIILLKRIMCMLQEMRRVEVHRAAEPAAPSQQQQWQAAAACAHLGRSQSETRRGGGGPEGAQGAEQLRVEPRAWSIAY